MFTLSDAASSDLASTEIMSVIKAINSRLKIGKKNGSTGVK